MMPLCQAKHLDNAHAMTSHNHPTDNHHGASKTVMKAHEAIVQSTHTQHLTQQATMHAKKSVEYATKSAKFAKKSAKFAQKAKKHAEKSAYFSHKASKHTRRTIGNQKRIMHGTIKNALPH